MPFTDIKIKELDENASGPSGEGSLQCLVLRLSQSSPYDWANYFNEAWRHHFYMGKRRATVSGNALEIICMPDELENLVPELNKVISQTNNAYKEYVEEDERQRQDMAEKAQIDKQKIVDLKARLKFD